MTGIAFCGLIGIKKMTEQSSIKAVYRAGV